MIPRSALSYLSVDFICLTTVGFYSPISILLRKIHLFCVGISDRYTGCVQIIKDIIAETALCFFDDTMFGLDLVLDKENISI